MRGKDRQAASAREARALASLHGQARRSSWGSRRWDSRDGGASVQLRWWPCSCGVSCGSTERQGEEVVRAREGGGRGGRWPLGRARREGATGACQTAARSFLAPPSTTRLAIAVRQRRPFFRPGRTASSSARAYGSRSCERCAEAGRRRRQGGGEQPELRPPADEAAPAPFIIHSPLGAQQPRQRAPVDLGPADRRSSRLALLRAAALLLSAIRTSRYALSSQEAHAENSQWPLGDHESGSVA